MQPLGGAPYRRLGDTQNDNVDSAAEEHLTGDPAAAGLVLRPSGGLAVRVQREESHLGGLLVILLPRRPQSGAQASMLVGET